MKAWPSLDFFMRFRHVPIVGWREALLLNQISSTEYSGKIYLHIADFIDSKSVDRFACTGTTDPYT